ncbi:MAG: hypothetical protein ACRDAX_09180 [Propionibacteriaceae bacterium]
MFAAIQAIVIVGGTLYGLPQLLRIKRSGTTSGVALLTWQITFATMAAWTIHGLLEANIGLIIPCFVSTAAAATVVVQIVQERELNWVTILAPVAVMFSICVGLRLVAGPLVFGIFVILPQIVAQSGQFCELVRNRNITGISVGFLWLGSFLQVMWLKFGMMLHDDALIVSSIVTLMIFATNLTWFYLRSWGIVAARPDFMRQRPTVSDLWQSIRSLTPTLRRSYTTSEEN